MLKIFKISLLTFFCLALVGSVFAQKSTRKAKPKKPLKPTVVKKAAVADAPEPVKKNGRPADDAANKTADETTDNQTSAPPQKANAGGKNNERPAAKKPIAEPQFFYQFTQPAFVVSDIKIEHDEKGKGQISFMKKDFDEAVTDPIQISLPALERINSALAALNFFDSNENYQHEKDFSHLGTVKLKIRKDARARETVFNWTSNQNAKALADEYRRIGQQYIWIFDITLARENQPLEAPKLLDSLDALMKRGEISDAEQMVPFLKELSDDERIPLIARNHAKRIFEKIEKKK